MSCRPKGFSFPKENRLLKKTDFYLKGFSMYERPFKFVYQEKKNNKLTNSRLGIVVSKKYSKSAVKRNQAKRVLREIFRVSSLRSYNIDLVVILSKPIDVASVNSDIKKFIREKFKKIEGRIIWAQNKKEH